MMCAFSNMLEPAQLRLLLLNIQDFDSRLLNHWWLGMIHGGGIYTGKTTRHHKSVFMLHSESWFISIPSDAHFIMGEMSCFSLQSPWFGLFLIFAIVNNIVVTITSLG